MANIVLSNQKYHIGESPCYVAYIYRIIGGTNIPLLREDVLSIQIAHDQYKIGARNGVAVRDWFPVRGSDGSDLHRFQVSVNNLYDQVVPLEGNNAFDYTDGKVFPYNFLYIPVDGISFYPSIGRYRTTIYMQIAVKRGSGIASFNEETSYNIGDKVTHSTSDGSIGVWRATVATVGSWNESSWLLEGLSSDIVDPQNDVGDEVLIFESEVQERSFTVSPVIYGQNIVFDGQIYTKHKNDQGYFLFPVEGNYHVEDVWLTVFDTTTLAIKRQRHSIGKNVISTQGLSGPEHNFNYAFDTAELPRSGRYTFHFEIEAQGVSQEDTYLCTFNVDTTIQ